MQSSLQIDVTVVGSTRLKALLPDSHGYTALLSQPTAHADLRLVPLWPILLVWAVGRMLGFIGKVTPSAMAGLPIFAKPAPSNLYTRIQHWFVKAGLRPHRMNTCNPLHVIARLASATNGAAPRPREVIDDCPDGAEIVILDTDPPVPPHRRYAMWWIGGAEAECTMLTDLAAEIAAAPATLQAAE